MEHTNDAEFPVAEPNALTQNDVQAPGEQVPQHGAPRRRPMTSREHESPSHEPGRVDPEHDRGRGPRHRADGELNRSRVDDLGPRPQARHERQRQHRRCRITSVPLEQPKIRSAEMHQLTCSAIETSRECQQSDDRRHPDCDSGRRERRPGPPTTKVRDDQTGHDRPPVDPRIDISAGVYAPALWACVLPR